MDLRNYLEKIFPNKEEAKYSNMMEDFKRLGIDSMSDLKYLNEEEIQQAKSLTRIEAKKLLDYLPNPDPDMLEKALPEIFSGAPAARQAAIQNYLNGQEIYNRADLLAVNTNKLMKDNFFSEAEIAKIERFLENKNKVQYEKIIKERELNKFNPERLDHVLKKIFSGTPDDRIKDIEKILRRQEVYSGNDILVVNTMTLRKGNLLSDAEVAKIEQYLRENNKEKYEEMREEKKTEDKKSFIKFESKIKMDEVKHKALVDERLAVVSDISELTKKNVELNVQCSENSYQMELFGFKLFSSKQEDVKNKNMLCSGSDAVSKLSERKQRLALIDQELKQMSDAKCDKMPKKSLAESK